MSNIQFILTIAVCAAATMLTRFLPFLCFLLYFDFIAHAEVVIAPYGVHLTERAQSDAISLRY